MSVIKACGLVSVRHVHHTLLEMWKWSSHTSEHQDTPTKNRDIRVNLNGDRWNAKNKTACIQVAVRTNDSLKFRRVMIERLLIHVRRLATIKALIVNAHDREHGLM